MSPDRQARTAETFVEFTRMIAGTGEHDVLRLLVEHCLTLLELKAAAIVMPDGSAGPCSVSDNSAGAIGWRSLLKSGVVGPGHACCRQRVVMPNVDLRATRGLWPLFAARALADHVGEVTAVPLRTPELFIGAVVLVGADGGRLDPYQLRVGRALAEAAAYSVATRRELRRRENLANQLSMALTSRVLIEQAKGVVAEHCQVSVAEAFQMLRAYARHNNQKLADLAAAVVEGTTGLLAAVTAIRAGSTDAGPPPSPAQVARSRADAVGR